MGITLDDIQASLHSIKISDGTNDLLIDASGHLSINDGGNSITVDGSVTVSATDLDIRDLTHVSDSVKVGDGTDFLAVAADGSIAVTDNGSTLSIDDGGGSITVDGSVTVSATDLDIRDLSAAQDNVAISDGTDTLAVNADGSINVNSVEGGYGNWQTSVVSATSTAGEVAATPLANRTRMIVQNLGTQDVYFGPANTVTTANGQKLPKGSSMEIMLSASADLWVITASGTADIRTSEFAA